MRRRALGAAALAVALLAGALAPGDSEGLEADAPAYAPVPDRAPTSAQERRLIQTFFDIRQGRIDDAITNLRILVDEQPDFRLAQLVYADLLMSRAGGLDRLGVASTTPSVGGYLAEARARLARYLRSPPSTGVPASLLRLPPATPAAIVVDISNFRLYLFQQRQGRYVRTRDFYVSIGKGGIEKEREGDEKTPIGVYHVAGFLPGDALPDLYGVGAFPIDYPNGWDRLKGRTGSGIWIHGTESDRYSRPPLSSRGCITLSNEDFETLRQSVEIGRTPVIVTAGVRWIDPDEIAIQRTAVESAVDNWRRDWESRDTDRYLSHYAAESWAGGMSRHAFADYKRKVNAGKKFIRVELDEVGIFSYPGERDLVLVDFLQRYESDNFKATRRKHQYWRRENAGWRIVLEEGV